MNAAFVIMEKTRPTVTIALAKANAPVKTAKRRLMAICLPGWTNDLLGLHPALACSAGGDFNCGCGARPSDLGSHADVQGAEVDE